METTLAPEINNQLAVIERSVTVLNNAGQILQSNKERAGKALNVGRRLLEQIQAGGMTPELDAKAMEYLAKINKALPEIKEYRAEVTQIMDELKKMYTGVENEIDPKKEGTVPFQVQAHRNQYVKDKAEQERKRREQEEQKAAKAQATIDLKASMATMIMNAFLNMLTSAKNKLLSHFNGVTLETYDEIFAKLRDYKPLYSTEKHASFACQPPSPYHSADEVASLAKEVRDAQYIDLAKRYKEEMEAQRDELLDKLPSKKSELLEQKRLAEELKATKDKEAKAALKKQQEEQAAAQRKREEEEQVRLIQEQADAQKLAEQQIEMNKQGEQTMVMFETEAALADSQEKPEAREGYEISVTHQAGYVQLFTLWFQSAGKELPMDKIEKTSLGQIKTWCEKHAHKTGEKIESKFISYNPTYRAINKRA